MFFAKNEIIELEDKKSYMVLDTAIIDNEIFYQIQEVDHITSSLIGPKTFIMAINDEGTLYIEDVSDPDLLLKLKEIFTS